MAKLIKTKGRDNRNLPPIANNKAKKIDTTNIVNLATLLSFFEEAFPINLSNK